MFGVFPAGLGGGCLQGRGVEVGETGLAIVVDADRQVVGQLAADRFLGIDDAIVEDVGQRGPQDLAQQLAERPGRLLAVGREAVVVDVDRLAERVVLLRP